MQRERIELKWASDLGLSSEKPTVNYTISLLPPDENDGNDDGADAGTTDTNDGTTSEPIDTDEPTTEKPADTEEGNLIDKVTGCFSVVGGGVALVMMLMLGAGCAVLKKKD